jgi:CHAT domain-containing protein/tetratricopeptide (TPR) repeat protein
MHLYIYFLIALFAVVSAPVSAAPDAPLLPAADGSDVQVEATISELSDLLDASKYPEVISLGIERANQVRLERPAGSLDEARLLDMVISAAYRSRQVMDESILDKAKRALQLKEMTAGPESAEYAASLINLASLHTYRWEGELAIPLFARAVAILEALGPESDKLRARVLSSQGVACRRVGDPSRAMELYREAMTIQIRVMGADHPDVASSLNNMGLIHSHFGDYKRAEVTHRRALTIREAAFGPDSEWVAETCNNLASVLSYLGEYEDSLVQQERAVNIFEDQLGLEHPRYWTGRQNLALCHVDMGDSQGALPHLIAVVEAMEKIYGPEHVNMTYYLESLGTGYRHLGDAQQALFYFNESLELGVATYGLEHDYNTHTMMEVGRAQIELGLLTEAADMLHRCLAIREQALPAGSLQLCELLHLMVDLHLQQGEAEEALQFADRSLKNLAALGENPHPLVAEGRFMRARSLTALGRPDEALSAGLAAEDVSRRHLQITMPAMSENLALDYASTRVVGQHLAVSLLTDRERGERVDQVWDSVIRSRSAVLDEFSARNLSLRRDADPQAVILADSSLALRDRIANLSLRGPGWEDESDYLESLDSARAALDQIERQLSQAGAGNRRVGREHGTGLEQVRAGLESGQALVAYLRSDDPGRGADEDSLETRYRAFVLSDRQAQPVILDLGAAEGIEKQIAAWRSEVASGGYIRGDDSASEGSLASTRGFARLATTETLRLDSYRTVAADLRRSIWDPLAELVAQSDRVFLVLDGDLHLVNFNALPVGDDEFLVERKQELHLLVNERSLAGTRQEFHPGTGVLAVGDPDFHGSNARNEPVADPSQERVGLSPCSEAESLLFDALPGARREVELVQELWRRSDRGDESPFRTLVGRQASETAFKSAFEGARIIHLATHGFFLAGSCAETGIGDSRWRNPLVLSGLALAGANSWHEADPGQEDGILTAEEVSALDLSGVEWAVLSACDTGLGVEGTHGEGVFGLQRAFTLAGARTVIMSLWSVRDDAARDWMEALYRARWLEERDTACSVHEATLAVLDARRRDGLSVHPYFWAGFTAVGDWH